MTMDSIDNVFEVMCGMDNTHTILSGDWNLILIQSLNCAKYNNLNNPLAGNKVLEMCNDLDVIDVWRIHNPYLRRYTWMQPQSSLDFFSDFI